MLKENKSRPRAGCLVIKNGKILLIIKNNMWQLPKGRIRDGESPQKAAVREVLEETGINCRIFNVEPITIQRAERIETYYLAKFISGKLKGNLKEHIVGSKWLTLKKTKDEIIDRQYPILKHFSSHIKNKL